MKHALPNVLLAVTPVIKPRASSMADLGGRAVQGVGLRPLACWNYGFESRQGHGCVSCECCVLSRRGLCVGLTTRPEESYRLWCVVLCVCVCVCVYVSLSVIRCSSNPMHLQ